MAAGAEGIVSAGMAPGLVTPAERKAFEEAQRRDVIIVQSSRAGRGEVLPRMELIARGAIAADNLNPQKARVLAIVGLSKTRSTAELQRMFDEY